MPGGMKTDLNAIRLKAIAIRHWRAQFGAITQRHDRERLWRCPYGTMATARMVGMAMRYQSALGGTRRVNPHVRRLHINAMGMRLYPMLGSGSRDNQCPFLNPDMGRSSDDVNRWPMLKFVPESVINCIAHRQPFIKNIYRTNVADSNIRKTSHSRRRGKI